MWNTWPHVRESHGLERTFENTHGAKTIDGPAVKTWGAVALGVGMRTSMHSDLLSMHRYLRMHRYLLRIHRYLLRMHRYLRQWQE